MLFWSSLRVLGSLLSGHKPAKYALGVFVPVLIDPQRSLGVAHADCDCPHRLMV